MQVKRSQLQQAVEQGLLEPQQLEPLWRFLSAQNQHVPRFQASHVLYYLGGLIALAAMSLFITLGWERFGGWGLAGIALAYGSGSLWLGRLLLGRQLALPAGILMALAVSLTPLAVYGVQHALGWWAGDVPYRDYHQLIDWRWMMMELATLACGVVLLWRYRLPFIMLPVAVTLWYMSMDLAPYLAGLEHADWTLSRLVSIYFGLLMLGLAFWVDVRSGRQPDFAFWLYLFGGLAFWGGLSLLDSDSELGKFGYLCVNLLLIACGTALARRVLAVLGGLGVAMYLGHLAYSVFRDSLLFPLALSLLGLAVVACGVWWQRREAALRQRLHALLPPPLRQLLTDLAD